MLIKDRRTFVNRSVRRVRSEVAVSFRFLILIFFLILILIPSLPERLRRRLRLRLRNPRTEPPLSITLVFAAPVESSRTADFGSIGLRFLALFRMATAGVAAQAATGRCDKFDETKGRFRSKKGARGFKPFAKHPGASEQMVVETF